MQARVDVENDISIVRLSGYLDFETVIPFKRDCLDTISTSKVIFDFETLNFVGSCGLTSFLQSLQTFGEGLERRPRFVGAGVEFRRLMQMIDFIDSDFFENALLAKESFIYSDAGAAAIDIDLRSPSQVEAGSLFNSGANQEAASADSSESVVAPTSEDHKDA